MSHQILSGEEFNTRIAAVFSSEEQACRCAQEMRDAGLTSVQVNVVAPDDQHPGRKLEPEDRGMARTLARSHIVLGAGGLLAGLLLWVVLYVLHVELIRAYPVGSLVAFLFFATAGGMMFGGFIAMRPDHQVVVQTVETARGDGEWSLVVHPRDSVEADKVSRTLESFGVKSVRSF